MGQDESDTWQLDASTDKSAQHHSSEDSSQISLSPSEGRDTVASLKGFTRENSLSLSDLQNSNGSPRSPRPGIRPRPGLQRAPAVFHAPKGKKSTSIDLETGKVGGARSQCALLREEFEKHPQSRRKRGLKRIIKLFRRPFTREDKRDRSASLKFTMSQDSYKSIRHISRRTFTNPHIDSGKQYQLLSIDEDDKGLSSIYDDNAESGWYCLGLHPNRMVTSYLFWAFRSSFLAVLISAAVWFVMLTVSFGLVLFGLGSYTPHCLWVADQNFDGEFMDAYSLSWTTFTTVGYGAVYPGTTATSDNIDHCWAITIVSTLESFVGILFASFWGAIFLSKVTRVSSFAQVAFSDAMVIRFGDGVRGIQEGESSDDESTDAIELGSLDSGDSDSMDHSHHRCLPCPVLEFRVVNRLAAQKKGEIIDASLNIVGVVDSSQIISLNGPAGKKKRKGKKGKGKKGAIGGLKRRDSFDRPSKAEVEKSRQKLHRILTSTREQTRVSEDDPNVADQKEFAKLFVESQDHPFFKRVWVARHVLDQESPLLLNDAKELIRINGGHWPVALNNAAAVRACVKFDQILVSLSGTSNADANTVYAQKIYDYSTLVVGYRFCNILYRDADGSLGVDQKLLNDVLQQGGGGGENLGRRTGDFRKAKINILTL